MFSEGSGRLERFPLLVAGVFLILPWVVIALELLVLHAGIWVVIAMLMLFSVGLLIAAALEGR